MAEAAPKHLQGLLDARRDEINEIAARHQVLTVAIFGSVARGEGGPHSDIDFLVEFAPGTRALEVLALESDLEEALGVKVEVGTPQLLKPSIRDRVLAEAVPL